MQSQDNKISKLKDRFRLTEEQTEKIDLHLQLVLERNKTLNLTSIKSYEDALGLHLEDSLLGAEAVTECPEGLLIDIGSGGGFPGITLALATGRQTVLVESVAKKAEALRFFITTLKIDDIVSVECMRAEDVGAVFRRKAAVVTARALAELPILLEYAEPMLISGGRLVAYKGQTSIEEKLRGEKVAEIIGFTTPIIRKHQLVSVGATREIMVYTKKKESLVSLPRRIGMAKKRPLA
jgi:16S rRNA (guanine527-N7)-methyltransferase